MFLLMMLEYELLFAPENYFLPSSSWAFDIFIFLVFAVISDSRHSLVE